MKLERKTDLRTINKQELDEKTQPWFQFEKEGKIEPRSKVRVGKKKLQSKGVASSPSPPTLYCFVFIEEHTFIKVHVKKDNIYRNLYK